MSTPAPPSTSSTPGYYPYHRLTGCHCQPPGESIITVTLLQDIRLSITKDSIAEV
ncbi:MAG: hypothetical protein F6K19_46665 [Cyanothece sp. SIO1E1]|nr:hypothetical protein [Cyanothece sp. SIO1E1]